MADATAVAASANASVLSAPNVDVRVERSKPDARRFAVLGVQLALLLVVFQVYKIEEAAFFSLACLVFAGFAVSFWLPFRFKQTFLIALSLAGAGVLLSPVVAALLVAVGLVIFAVVRSRLAFRWKVLLLLGILAIAAYGRATGRFPVPREFWPVLGSMFLFRLIVYMYDLSHMKGPPALKDYLSYFFLLPNYYFLMFPVIDFQTFRKSYFKRDIHTIAQQGVWWIFRGTTHILLYRVIYQAQGRFSPPNVPVAAAVAAKAAFAFLLYLRISGQFHIIAGMLCLFGYDLPETNHRYLLASGISDLWRRINIYWKDFMVKIVYFPAYFRMRGKGELRAQLLATALVFVVTWFLHAVQFFWLQGKLLFSLNDSLFWGILGSVVLADVWLGALRPKRLPRTGWISGLQRAAKIAATFAFMSLLWSMWSANSMTEWFLFLKTGNV